MSWSPIGKLNTCCDLNKDIAKKIDCSQVSCANMQVLRRQSCATPSFPGQLGTHPEHAPDPRAAMSAMQWLLMRNTIPNTSSTELRFR